MSYVFVNLSDFIKQLKNEYVHQVREEKKLSDLQEWEERNLELKRKEVEVRFSFTATITSQFPRPTCY